MDETNPHTTTDIVNIDTKKERMGDGDENDNLGLEKRRRIDEVRTKEIFPLEKTIADPATCKLWDLGDL